MLLLFQGEGEKSHHAMTVALLYGVYPPTHLPTTTTTRTTSTVTTTATTTATATVNAIAIAS